MDDIGRIERGLDEGVIETTAAREGTSDRWAAFTLNELREIHDCVYEQVSVMRDDEVNHRRARLAEEVQEAIESHEQQPSYRGPGVYRDCFGRETRVLGLAFHSIVDQPDQRLTVHESDGQAPADFYTTPIEFFEGREEDGRRRFEFVRGLGEEFAPEGQEGPLTTRQYSRGPGYPLSTYQQVPHECVGWKWMISDEITNDDVWRYNHTRREFARNP